MKAIKNPFLEEIKKKKIDIRSFYSHESRRQLVRKYSWAIPTNKVIQEIASYPNILEMGAGNGYWAHMIEKAGGKIYPVDMFTPIHNKHWLFTTQWTTIHLADSITKVKKKNFDTLFLCWPPYDTDFAYECLMDFTGKYLVYVGESRGGCTANENFFDLVDLDWKKTKIVKIPQWEGINDNVWFYEKKNSINLLA